MSNNVNKNNEMTGGGVPGNFVLPLRMPVSPTFIRPGSIQHLQRNPGLITIPLQRFNIPVFTKESFFK